MFSRHMNCDWLVPVCTEPHAAGIELAYVPVDAIQSVPAVTGPVPLRDAPV